MDLDHSSRVTFVNNKISRFYKSELRDLKLAHEMTMLYVRVLPGSVCRVTYYKYHTICCASVCMYYTYGVRLQLYGYN